MKNITLSLLLLLPILGFSQGTCATAQAVTVGTHAVASVNGTQLPTPSCTTANTGVAAAVWYSFTATVSGIATVSSNLPANSGGDTRLHVYSGTCGSLTCIGFNDDVNATAFNYLSEVTFGVVSGTTYYFAWDDFWEATGFTFLVSETAVSCETTVPYTETFASAAEFATCYETLDADANGFSWIQQSLDLNADGTAETFATNASYPTVKNDWLFSPTFTLVAGETYNITYRYNGANNGTALANETMEVLITDSPNTTPGFSQQLGLHSNIIQVGTFATLHQTAIEQTTTFTPAETYDYHLAFHVITPAPPAGSNGFLLLFEYDIEVSLATPEFGSDKTAAFPNPVKNELNIVQQNTIDTVEIYNMMGQRVLNQNFSSENVVVNTEMLSAGTYMVKVLSQNGTNVLKVIKN